VAAFAIYLYYSIYQLLSGGWLKMSVLSGFKSLHQDAKGNDVDLSIYKGKVLLIVNVASQWYSN
jgi:Glutathione peroxidase